MAPEEGLNERLKELQEQVEQEQAKPCPTCGRCPSCGRGGAYYPMYPPYPWHPGPWTNPYQYPQIVWTTCGTGGSSSTKFVAT